MMCALSHAAVLLHPVFPWEGDDPSWVGTIILLLFVLLVLGAVAGVIYLLVRVLKRLF